MNTVPRSTRVLSVDARQPQPDIIREAAAVLREGGTVAFPTETVYGLGANALDAAAVARVFAAKGRPAHDPVIVHLASADDISRIARHIPDVARVLADRFWPGPLSLVLPRQPEVPDAVTAGLDSVAVRVPAHPVALALIAAAGVPVAAPSANLFGHTSPTTAAHVLEDLNGRIDLVVDGGTTMVGVESTVLDLTGDRPLLLRPGGVSLEQLAEVLGEAPAVRGVAKGQEMAAPSPGLLVTHYAPRAEFRLFVGDVESVRAQMRRVADQEVSRGGLLGLLVTDDDAIALSELGVSVLVERLGGEHEADVQAQRLYAAMRRLDAAGVTLMLARLPDETGLGRAIGDRLRRAAGGTTVQVTRD